MASTMRLPRVIALFVTNADPRPGCGAGGEKPRRILCCGYCFGGGMATLAATWAALQVPTADTR